MDLTLKDGTDVSIGQETNRDWAKHLVLTLGMPHRFIGLVSPKDLLAAKEGLSFVVELAGVYASKIGMDQRADGSIQITGFRNIIPFEAMELFRSVYCPPCPFVVISEEKDSPMKEMLTLGYLSIVDAPRIQRASPIIPAKS